MNRITPRIKSICAAIMMAGASLAWADTTDWTTDDHRILKNGEPFFAKGVCYYPLPAGNVQGTKKVNGTEVFGAPYGDFFYNFEGQEPVWKNILERDLPAMRAAGINMVRLYAMWAWADADWVVSPLNGNKARVLSHQKFLDMAWNNGDHPIQVLITVYIEAGKWSDPAYQAQIEDVYTQLAKEMKDHPALMGFIVGNELNNAGTRDNPQFWAWIDHLGALIKEQAPNKLVATSLVDDGLLSVKAGKEIGPKENGRVLPHIDVWGLNVYRGDGTNGFTREFWQEYKQYGDRPMLFTEWGVPASVHIPDTDYAGGGKPEQQPDRALGQAKWLENHYVDMTDHSILSGGLSSGGALFMWSDVWDKQECATCLPQVQDGSNGTGSFPGKWWDEEWFGINAIVKDPNRPWFENWNTATNKPWTADTLVPRAAYDSISKLFTEPDPEIAVRSTSQGFAAESTTAAGTSATLASGETFRLVLGVDPNRYAGTTASWYLSVSVYDPAMPQNVQVFHYGPDGQWYPAPDQTETLPITPAWVGPIFQLSDFAVHQGTLPPGHYDFNFALAIEQPGGEPKVFFDTTSLEVTP